MSERMPPKTDPDIASDRTGGMTATILLGLVLLIYVVVLYAILSAI